MFTASIIKIFNRDLEKLKYEINAYSNEKNIWLTIDGITNCSGNLSLHLIGNLNAFIGAKLGNTGYVRQRELEFSIKNISRLQLIKQIDDVKNIVENTLKTLTEEDLQSEYKRKPDEAYMTTEYFLIHLTTHLAYHLGQINYHRRILDIN